MFLLQELGSASSPGPLPLRELTLMDPSLNAGRGMRNAFAYRCDITFKARADSTQNTESNVTLSALHSSQITAVQTALHCEDLLAIAHTFRAPRIR
jgi:hypothetical protein